MGPPRRSGSSCGFVCRVRMRSVFYRMSLQHTTLPGSPCTSRRPSPIPGNPCPAPSLIYRQLPSSPRLNSSNPNSPSPNSPSSSSLCSNPNSLISCYSSHPRRPYSLTCNPTRSSPLLSPPLSSPPSCSLPHSRCSLSSSSSSPLSNRLLSNPLSRRWVCSRCSRSSLLPSPSRSQVWGP